jgi:mannose-6-phosphate isomerase-like protein (cupin superfamily)
MVEKLVHNGIILSIIIRAKFSEPGLTFFTPEDFSQQLAFMQHPAGKEIAPHVHNPAPREVRYTQEVLFIRKGRLRIDFYDNDRQYLESRILECGDTILLASAGHGFEVLEDLEMIEVKQGPYAGDQDKVKFAPVDRTRLKVENES